MSGRPKSQPGLMAERSKIADGGEPLYTETRRTNKKTESVLSHTIPSEARKLLGLVQGTEIQIEVYRDGYFVTTAEGENGSE